MFLRVLLILGGLAIAACGIHAFSITRHGAILNAGMSLGGIFIICALFSIKLPIHATFAATVTSMVGSAGNFSALRNLAQSLATSQPADPDNTARAAMASVSIILLVACLRAIARLRQARV